MRYKIFNKHDEDLGKISKNMKFQEQITVKNIDHLGLVAGLIDDLGIVEHINQLVGEQPGEIVNPGLAVKAIDISKNFQYTSVTKFQAGERHEKQTSVSTLKSGFETVTVSNKAKDSRYTYQIYRFISKILSW